jgi:hypothetical protein
VSRLALSESKLRPTFSMAAKTALPGGSESFPAGASVPGAAASAGALNGFLVLPSECLSDRFWAAIVW